MTFQGGQSQRASAAHTDLRESLASPFGSATCRAESRPRLVKTSLMRTAGQPRPGTQDESVGASGSLSTARLAKKARGHVDR
jgi:hypothetical protein